jgi:hypothetical protein
LVVTLRGLVAKARYQHQLVNRTKIHILSLTFLRVKNTSFPKYVMRGLENKVAADWLFAIYSCFCKTRQQLRRGISCNLHAAVKLHLLLAPSFVVPLLPLHGAQTLKCTNESS